MIVNGELIRRRRAELGYSARAIAAHVGVTSSVICRLENGDNHLDVTVGLLTKIAELLAVDLPALFAYDGTRTDDPETASADVATLGALLLGVKVAMPVSTIVEALDWSRERTVAALDGLADALNGAGMRLSRTGTSYGITRALEPVNATALTALLRAHYNRSGLDRTEATMLRRIATTGAPNQRSNPETVAIGTLLNAGLIEPATARSNGAEAPLVLTDATRFSLLLDDEPDRPGEVDA